MKRFSASSSISLAAFLGATSALGFALTGAGCSDAHDDDGHTHEADAAVDSGGNTSDSAAAASVITFQARVGAAPFSCATPATGVGTAKTTVEPLDFRLYVHDVLLVRADGSEVPFVLTDDGVWQKNGLALLDFEDKTGTCANGTTETNVTLRGNVPAGTYTGIKLTVGIPDEDNFKDPTTAASPLNLTGLYWSWASGYKFARIDVRVPAMDMGDAGMHMEGGAMDAGAMDGGGHGSGHGDPSSFVVHLGSTGCTGSGAAGTIACTTPNRGAVSLTGFDPTKKTILVDYAALVADVDVAKDKGGAPGCMSGSDDPECASILKAFGIGPTGAPDATGQRFFRVE